MRQGSPTPQIDSASADEVFSHIETIIIPTVREKQSTVSDGHEKVERQNVEAQTESMMKRTVTALKKLFGYGEPNRRPRTRRSLGGIQHLEARMLMSGTPAEIRMIDTNGAYVLQQETVTEAKKIDFSTLAHGVYPEKWTTTIEGLGQVTMWFQGGTRVDSQGISAVQQPLGGTSFWIKFDNGPVKVLSAELVKDAATQGFVRVQANGDYVRENGVIKDYPLSNAVQIDREISLIDAGQRDGSMGIKSLTVGIPKTQTVKDYIEPEVVDLNANGIADELALAQQEGLEEVLAPVGVTMETIGNQGVLGIRITAPFDETYLDTGRWGVVKTVHQGGANDLRIFNNYLTDMMDNAYGSQTKTMMLYADQERQVPLTELTFVGNRGGISLLSAISQPVRKNILPEGIEAEPVPKMHIAHLSGPNVLFQVSSPIAQSTIEFANVHADSILGTATVVKTAEGVTSSASITMNPANPSGDYNVLMKGPDGRVFERVLLRWDRDTKKLTLGAGEAMWTPPESLQPSVDAAVAGLTQSLVDMTTNDASLKTIQQEILLTAASSMPGMNHDLETAFFAAHPEWAPALREAMNATQLQQFSDTYGIMRENYGKFQGMLGDLLKQASQILCQIRNGGNESELRRVFAITVDSYATSLPMVPLASIGIRMPTSTQILFAAKCACDRVGVQLVALKEVERLMILAAQERSNNPNYAGSGSAAPTSTELEAEKRKQQIRAAQSGLSMFAQDGQTEIGRGGVLFTDAGSIYVAGTNNVVNPETLARITNINASLQSSSNSYKYGIIPLEGKSDNESIPLTPRGNAVITFELKERMMVNLTMAATEMGAIVGPNFYGAKPDIDFKLLGKENNVSLSSSNKGTSGESISAILDAGTYYLTVADVTSYGNATTAELKNTYLPEVPVHVEYKPFNSAEIIGTISTVGSQKVMPVSMRVAKFDGENRVTNYERNDIKNSLDPSKPVWVVIHGRTDSEKSGKMEDLTKALTEYATHEAKGMQIVTIDWSEAAKNFNSLNPDAWDISDSRWVQAVGEWIGDTLLKIGFSPDQISGTFHSHANGVGFHMANFLKQKTGQNIHLFMALDPAKNPGLAGGNTAYNDLNISSVSNQSVAFDSSWLGSSHFSGTANRSFLLQTETNDVDPTNGVIDKYLWRDEDILKHGAGLGTVASMIRSLINGQATPFDPADLRKILNGTGEIGVRANTLAGDEQPLGAKVYEGQIVIRTELQSDSASNKWLTGKPISFQYIDAVTGRAERRSISGLMLEDHDGENLNVGEQDQSWLGDINSKNEYIFESTSNRETVFQFTLPKPGTMLRLRLERVDGSGLSEEFIIDNEHTSVSLLTLTGTYKVTLSQIAPSQHYVIGGSPTDADIPYTLSIF